MTEYIDREAVIKAIEFNKGVGCSDRCAQAIKYIPAADLEIIRSDVRTPSPEFVKAMVGKELWVGNEAFAKCMRESDE